jgi:hypothetical protein
LITPGYIGQYVEIERQRQLLLQRERFERFRLRTFLEETRRKLLYRESESENDNK